MAHGCAVWSHSVKGAVPSVITILQDSERTLEGQFGQLDEDGLNGEAGEGWRLAERGSQGVERQGGHFFTSRLLAWVGLEAVGPGNHRNPHPARALGPPVQ